MRCALGSMPQAGALTAMQDAIAFANWIATLESKAVGELDTIFKQYCSERYPIAVDTFARSQMFNKVLGNNLQARRTRIIMRRISSWLRRKIVIKATESRRRVSFLPLVEDKGSVKHVYHAILPKTLAIMTKAAVRGHDATEVNAVSPV
ncbi:hypothetical protein CPB97_006942 [Podila verticillata]|nr:hypothetical protein CPB97_006942 [Podila verticillata]